MFQPASITFLTPATEPRKGVFRSFDFCLLLDQIGAMVIYLLFFWGGGDFWLFICSMEFKKCLLIVQWSYIHKNMSVEWLCMKFNSIQFQYNLLASYDFGLFFDIIFRICVAEGNTHYCKEFMTHLNKALLNFPDYCVSIHTGYVYIILYFLDRASRYNSCLITNVMHFLNIFI